MISAMDDQSVQILKSIKEGKTSFPTASTTIECIERLAQEGFISYKLKKAYVNGQTGFSTLLITEYGAQKLVEIAFMEAAE
jgi:hypothetical protein